jgi:hypothetical protein
MVGPLKRPDGADDSTAYRGPLVSWEAIPVRDIAGKESYTLTIEKTGTLQRLALLRMPNGNVALAIATRFTDMPGSPSSVDISVYRLHVEPIPDGERVYFSPWSSWRTTDNYASATEALNRAFGISMPPDGQEPCAAGAAQR